MLRTLLIPGLLLAAVLTASILLLRLRPYDARDVQVALAVMDDCTRPCFLGIRPGITTDEQAQVLLVAHPWVTELVVYRDTGGQVRNMVWDWNAQAPPLMGLSGVLDVFANRVVRITLRTFIPTGDMWLVYGPPPRVHAESIFFLADYHEQGFISFSNISCGTFWQGWVAIMIEAAPPVGYGPYNLATIRKRVCSESR